MREAISQELAELDVREKAIMEPISHRRLELRRLWNYSILIHRVPNELLIQIFRYLPHTPWSRRNANGQPLWLDLGWPGLMLVCRHWRDLLVSTPAFWKEVNLRRQTNWTNLCISRSAESPINVHVESNCSLRYFNDCIRPHVHRFKDFYFSSDLPNTPLSTAIAPLLDSGMPLLQTLHFRLEVLDTSLPQINTRITSQGFPSLRVLELQSAIMVAPQDISLYSQLRELELSQCSLPLSLDGFLDVLAASMQLEKLNLRMGMLHRLSGQWPHSGYVPYRPLISLPRLRDFLLDDYRIDHVSCFLAHLRLQPFIVLFVQGQVSDNTANTVDAMLPPNRTTTLPALSFATNAHVSVRGGEYTIGCGYVRPHLKGPENSPRVILKLNTGNRDELWNGAMGQGLDDLIHAFGPSPLRRLCVSGDRGHGTTDAWERVFRAFPLLEELIVLRERHNTHDVSDVFLGLHAASAVHADSTVACPSLRDIRVEGPSTVATYEAMRDCFRYRADRGVVLETLDLEASVGWADVPSPLRHGFVKDICAVVKVVRTAHHMKEWGVGGHDNLENSSDGPKNSGNLGNGLARIM